MKSAIAAAGRLIDPFVPSDGPPPQRLWPFLRWSLRGTMPVLWVSGALSAVVGTLEVVSALLLGRIIDTALSAGPEGFFAGHAGLLLFSLAFFVLLRPLTFGISAAANGIVVQPNVNPLVLQRLHRWTMGHAVTFFDNDFAGRIAQKQMQTARAITDVVSEVINTGFYSLASILGAAFMLTAIDVRIAGALALWLVAYIWLIAWFMPRIQTMSTERANARSNGLRTGRRHHHQHQDGQAFRPRRL
jgi:ATP-binding cassette, subfamily B, bacterial